MMSEDQNVLISLGVIDRIRLPMGSDVSALVRVRKGNQKEVLPDFYPPSKIPPFKVKAFNNFGDYYSVVASAHGYVHAGSDRV